ncbi:CRISPR-associated helicase Cas3 [Thioploca ingrica]|uniref:CRISPR-associated helicase Cas3 n=1 Tax=Thioploca ingrica TaxID=40754 RepID=A0A090AHR2_9GAMM|nr:CRISPR-associated helicase Cas3 [Thioploca ingrica]
MTLQSHHDPHKTLREHLQEVQQATHFILSCHSVNFPQTIINAIVQCHDLGKGSPAFQTYIQNPAAYNKNQADPRAKSHAFLSAVLATLWAQQEQWPAFDTLILTQAVACHHAGFKNLDELEIALELDIDDPLAAQYTALDLSLLSEISGLNLQNIDQANFEAAKWWLFKQQKIKKQLTHLALESALSLRLWAQFCLSVLLEADKAFLALHEEGAAPYLQKTAPEIPPAWIDNYLTQTTHSTPFDAFRATLQAQVILNSQVMTEKCFTLTLPTGAGKTLIAARWALALRQQLSLPKGFKPKIIVVLPYLSIIDQVEKIYQQVLGITTEEAHTDLKMASHSLADRNYELEGKALSDSYAEFFLNTWRSEVVITTFDQLLLTFFSEQNKHLMRFHNLMDAIIILDEVQTLPPRLWDIINQTLQVLAKVGQSRILMMSATQPQFLTPAQELVGTPEQVTAIFNQCQRYQIHLQHHLEQPLTGFIDSLITRVKTWLAHEQRVMITLNTRASAKRVWQALQTELALQVPIYLVSADVTPRDRLEKISNILNNQPCLVVSTQTVEAGIDIDMDVIIRDFAPLDKLIQVAGRCNRHNHRGKHGGYVEIVRLLSFNGQKYANYIYDPVLLNTTFEILENYQTIGEESVLTLSEHYFQLLHRKMNTGKELTKQYAYWQALEKSIHTLLRPQGEQISFTVLDDQKGEILRSQIKSALEIKGRWARRQALQKLAGGISERSVNVYQRRGFHPEDYADLLGYLWILKAGFYTSAAGLDLKLIEDDPAACIF